MFYYFFVFLFQVSFNILKVLEIKYTYQNKIKLLLVNSVLINLVSLGSIFLSVDKLLEGNFFVIPFYVSGSVVGKWFAMTHLENVRYKVFTFLLGKKE